MRVGDKVRLLATGETGVVEQVRKFIGCPLCVRAGDRLHWVGYPDVRRL